ncbi:MAG: Alcohol dehydrogenase zinc-binding domain protein, partial [Paenibacillus sp.]|nr:Alcohol dehydrogenase zinc-binding domain protein [Paenibacillus sp.]
LQLKEVETPSPKPDEVRIRIRAAVVTPSDCAFRKADPFMIRFMYGLVRPKYAVLGVELAGEVESVGKDVRLFKEGDPVFGISPHRFGTYAEYVCLPEGATLIAKPANATYDEAAGLCDGALTALIFLRDVAHIQPGQKVLINGASGSVGAYAVQLAKYFGANVTGVCSTANVALVKALGADQVIDYTKEDFTRTGLTYDILFDAVGKSSFARCRSSLQPQGIYLSTVPSADILLRMLWTAKSSGKKAKFAAAGLRQNKENLLFLKTLMEEGAIREVIDKRYSLEQLAEAHRYVEQGHKRGNVIITIP